MVVEIEFHVEVHCPYCRRLKQYVIDPLKYLGYINVREVYIDLLKDHPSLKKNMFVANRYGYKVMTPLIFIKTGKNEEFRGVVIAALSKKGDVKYREGSEEYIWLVVGRIAENLIEYLSIVYGVSKWSIISKHPLLIKVFEWLSELQGGITNEQV